MTDFTQLQQALMAELASITDLTALEALRVAALGKKGQITALMQNMASLAPDERKTQGAAINALKEQFTAALEAHKAKLEHSELEARLGREHIDITLPIRQEREGRIHPISQTIDEIISIFGGMGFVLADGPDIEDDEHNFTALNIPPAHPARQMHDTFYLPRSETHEQVLRTHTSPVQIRTMRGQKPPIRVIIPGRTFRSDYDQTHTPMFHQVEALVIEENIHMGHLRGTINEFLRQYFNLAEVKLRFRPSHFPFTEPSAEVDIGCDRSGKELKIGAGNDWLEILGCGMVHPKVLAACGLDPTTHQGFALGMGIERIAMLKYGIPDLRTFFESDLRWLRHYGFSALDIPHPSLRSA